MLFERRLRESHREASHFPEFSRAGIIRPRHYFATSGGLLKNRAGFLNYNADEMRVLANPSDYLIGRQISATGGIPDDRGKSRAIPPQLTFPRPRSPSSKPLIQQYLAVLKFNVLEKLIHELPGPFFRKALQRLPALKNMERQMRWGAFVFLYRWQVPIPLALTEVKHVSVISFLKYLGSGQHCPQNGMFIF